MKTAAAVLVILILVGAAGVFWLRLHGFGAREEPSALEAVIARNLRWLATPLSVRALKNPVEPSDELLAEGHEHFNDHCAICHGKDGSGDTPIGRGLYPKPPDLRQEPTQSLSDGELFSIIQDGIRFSGMPAFGGEEHEAQDSWELVHFIRRLPKMTPEEIRGTETASPKGPSEPRGERAEHEFLEGGD